MTRPDDTIEVLQAEVTRLNETVSKLQNQLAAGKPHSRQKPCIRRESSLSFFGLPLYSIAMGPDPASGEKIGHARGIIAIGDRATGFVAIGGIARGILAMGGIAQGIGAVGGLAIGVFAVGGCAVGAFAAVGGVAAGYFAVGGVAYGVHPVGGAAIKM